ncbi:MAG: DUF2784 domain-containing protein [Bacteroidales bacterium]|nr:DUF2784 domain-containing protein [Bacteroidales bacterium]
MYKLLADSIVLIHLAFILFVVLGGLLVLKWKWFVWIHLPAAVWGILIEFAGWICPLTPWENALREKAGQATYEGDFTGNYLLPLIYPDELTHHTQVFLGSFVLILNLTVYSLIIFRYFRKKRA